MRTYLKQWAIGPAVLLLLSLVGAPALAYDDEDPWEGLNRKVFAVNEFGDRWVVRPVARAYVAVTPRALRRGVTNVFSNIGEVPSALNGLLQAKPGHAGNSTGRFVVNSTVGLAGIFDVARHVGLERRDREDFGQTLAVWGTGQGPYMVLPVLGPSTLRDTLALPVEWYTDPITYIDHTRTRNSTVVYSYFHARAGLLDIEKAISGDRYTFIRDAYLQRRHFLIHDGEVEDDFGAGFDDFGDYGDYGDYDDFGDEDDPDEFDF
ncbi:MlaA family lipoprotein [Marinimicrobium alkaliphilum]|uniref:MlaA family lipoprotein n=1 Tax=Marinimicrobium alkaliphilum TaxID=2202654 RepID=UPI000DB9E950|nr:VacJ family lipoprotein [Marinimicrobium alkaliphilum]